MPFPPESGGGHKGNRAPLLEGALFASHTFLLMGTGSWSDLATMSESFNTVLYYAREVALLLGFLCSVAIAERQRRSSGSLTVHRGGISCVTVLFACCVAVQAFFAPLAVPAVFLIAFLVGLSGGAVYARIAHAASRNSNPARMIGLTVGAGGALAVVGHYVTQIMVSLGVFLPALFIACSLLIAYLMVGNEPVEDGAVMFHNGKKGDVSPARRTVLCASVASICLFALFSFYSFAMRDAFGAGVFYEWQRLFVAVGYIVIGATAFFGGRAMSSLAVTVLALFTVLVTTQGPMAGEASLTLALFYVLVGAVIAWNCIVFMSVSPQSRHPVLTASMGRIIEGVVTIAEAVLVFAVNDPAEVSPQALLIVTLFLLAMIIVVMVRGGLLPTREMFGDGEGTTAADAHSESAPAAPPSREEIVARLATECGLTDREREVFEALVLTEKKNQQIADDLGISRRQVQTHISHIYEKTGTQTRAGLVMRIGNP